MDGGLRDDEVLLPCPYCGAETAVDLASIGPGEERVVVDCTVCCRPSRLVGIDDGGDPGLEPDE